MRTDDLIEALVEDRAHAPLRPRLAIGLALITGAVLAALVFMTVLGWRHDISAVAGTYRFLFKFVVTLTLAASALALLFRVFRPETVLGRALWLIAIAPAMLVLAAIAELIVMPPATWAPRLVGVNSLFCLIMIPLISVAPLLAFLAALRRSAPADPGLAGALAGLAAAAIAATLYASHCIDDSPLFVITWYSIAIAIVTTVGYVAGRRWLRW